MTQRREVAEVLRAAEDLSPVREVEQAGQEVAMQVGLLLGGAEQRDPDADRDQHGEQGRQQSAGTAKPELTQRQCRCCARVPRAAAT